MKQLKGTSLFCGIGVSLKEMEEHLKMASELGINAVFTSLQLPESNRDEVLRDFRPMADIAHHYGLLVDADLSTRSAKMFGINTKDFKEIKKFGVDIARLDGGYTDEETVKAINNDEGIIIDLNASVITEEKLEKYTKLGANPDQVRFCHNYHPMRYTGISVNDAIKQHKIIHNYGFRVSGFIPSVHHPRIGCSIGLPTLERHRFMDPHCSIQECYLLGFDDIFFGDDLASKEELTYLATLDPQVTELRMKKIMDCDVIPWLDGRILKGIGYGDKLDPIPIVRSAFISEESIYKPWEGFNDGIVAERKRGDVSVCKKELLRYAGEIQIAKCDLPSDEYIGKIGEIIPQDLPLLDIFNPKTGQKFKIVIEE